MSKLAIQGLLALTTTLWLPAQADTASRSSWTGEPSTETRLNADDAAENSPALIRPAARNEEK